MLYRRSVRWRYIRALLILVAVLIILDFLSLSWTFSRQRLSAVHQAAPPSLTERIFISSPHWNNEAILRSHWNSAVLDLVRHVGPSKIYVSIYESGSWDDSKGALRELDAQLDKLGVRRTIALDETTHADEIAKPPAQTGWVDTPRGKKELRRIPYLSKLRNLTLKPLEELALEGIIFDKILYLNDVIFTTEDIKRLFATRDGDYAAACSMDFSHPPLYYDTFALRDSNGDEPVTQTFPYFGSSASRNAMITGQAVPLQSCWNGMVVFKASPFYQRRNDNDSEPLRFRGIPDSLAKYHLEASECCLIHVDNPLTSTRGVWMNPSVRVAYNAAAYATVNGAVADGKRSTGWWPSMTARIRGIWRNRLVRYTSLTWPRRWKVMRRVRKWEAENRRSKNIKENEHEIGTICLIDEMQVLVANGWAHL
ncbi:MAG: hypothetical protein M1816_002761 [Peltula sp. TS41687]|nr:MAG: hypothetical protein M1816_002761 [Peltula sp. TS41687]